MRPTAFAFAVCLTAMPALADTARVTDSVILPAMAGFATQAGVLADTAATDCSRASVLPAYHAAFDAWMPIADLRLGPSEAAALTIAFWPDERGAGARTLSGLIAAQDQPMLDPVAYAQVSAAARGFFALDLLMGDAGFDYASGSYTCQLVQTVTADLAEQAADLNENWQDHAALLRDPGGAGNLTYLDKDEARSAIFTQIVSSLAFTTDSRLARPLGTFDRPRPARAEGWRTGRSLPNALGAAHAAHAMAVSLADVPLPVTDAALAAVEAAAQAITDPGFQDIADPAARLRVEIMQQRIVALKGAIETELGAAYGISAGFNAQDGD